MNSEKRASLSIILSGILWGVISIFVRHLSACGLDSMQISLVRMAVAASVMVLYLLITDREKLKIHPKDIWMFVCTGIISVVLFNTCYFYCMIHGQASVAVILLYTSPVFVMLMSALFFREKITGIKVIALVLSFAGFVLVSGITGGIRLPALVLITGIASGFFYGLYSIFGTVALRKYESVTVTAYTFIFGLIGSIPLGKPAGILKTVTADPRLILWCLGIGVISTALPYFFYTGGLQKTEPGRAAILVAVEPLVGAMLGMFVYNESKGIMKIAGMICILVSITLLNIPRADRDNKTKDDTQLSDKEIDE